MKFKGDYTQFKRSSCRNCGTPLHEETLCFDCSKLPQFANLRERQEQKELTRFT